MATCYVFSGYDGYGNRGTFFKCCDNPGWLMTFDYSDGKYYTPADNGQLATSPNYVAFKTPLSIISVSTQSQLNAALQGTPRTYYGDYHAGCGSCIFDDISNPPNPDDYSFNCVNGQCVKVMGNSGFFSTLAACQSSCTGGGVNNQNQCQPPKQCLDPNQCPPGKVCLEQGEYGQIVGLISSIRGEIC